MVADLCEREREILQERRRQELEGRRAHRNELEVNRPSDRALITATTLSDIEAVTSRPGFLREQLKLAGLTPLRRWHLQLKLMVAEDAKTQQVAVDGDDVETAMQSLEKMLSRDQRCYAVVYREGARVTDARESLLDEGASTVVRELLSFSSRHESFICRVTCVHDGKRVLFSSTVYIENLQTELERLLTEENNVHAAITFIWNTLAT
ncbi:hypothetical protein PI124_g10956 [Phytophthora idaei]|nr:hypothetical protein PI125_g10313 [Phytophthora idaei]KAG3154422.1 hypothetical protein PI126_g9628 [Phytophthora idaei]KAG3244259.1 hypothetical protein PI124_g10956 [Phytophthora idaei]